MVRKASALSGRGSVGEGPVLVAAMVESIVGCKWSVRQLELCAAGELLSSEFLRACPGLSARVANERLRTMTGFGLLQRTVVGDKPSGRVEYRLTLLGCRFTSILEAVRQVQEAVDGGQFAAGETAPSTPPREAYLTPPTAAAGRIRAEG